MSVYRVRRWGAGVFLASGAAVATAIIGAGTAHADDSVGSAGDTTSDAALTVPLGTGSGNEYDPAVVPYSSDPSNLFSPVYTIKPIGPEDVTSSVTDPNNPDTYDVYGTQEYGVFNSGIFGGSVPVDTFTGHVEYTPTPFDQATGLSGIVGELSKLLGGGGGSYSEEIGTLGSAGTLLPEPTEFLVSEFGFGYGNVFEGTVTSTSITPEDFLLTPFGDENLTPIVDLFLPPGITNAAADPSVFGDLLT
jgi:hypothetical protein